MPGLVVGVVVGIKNDGGTVLHLAASNIQSVLVEGRNDLKAFTCFASYGRHDPPMLVDGTVGLTSTDLNS